MQTVSRAVTSVALGIVPGPTARSPPGTTRLETKWVQQRKLSVAAENGRAPHDVTHSKTLLAVDFSSSRGMGGIGSSKVELLTNSHGSMSVFSHSKGCTSAYPLISRPEYQ